MRIDRVKFVAAMARADVNGIQLAKIARISRCTITAVKTGKSCRKETVDKLAAALGVDPAELIEEVTR